MRNVCNVWIVENDKHVHGPTWAELPDGSVIELAGDDNAYTDGDNDNDGER